MFRKTTIFSLLRQIENIYITAHEAYIRKYKNCSTIY